MFTDAAKELAGFLASFLAVGAAGFRYAMRKRHDDETVWTAARRAAVMGLIGASVMLAIVALNARKHAVNQMMLLQLGGWIVAIVAYALAAANKRALWPFAATGVIVASLAPLFVGEFARAVNPIHRFAGGLWIGTLFVIAAAGCLAELIDVFSPLALTSFAFLAGSGVWTAWKHLKRIDALWTTPYGYALIAKLCVVAVVVALGAFNWRRHRAATLRRSATWELAAAGVVLMITAVLVSLPSPR
jgi:putative copper export protein